MAEFRIPQLPPHLLFLLPGHEICSPTALPLGIWFVVQTNKSVHAVIGAPQKHASLLQIWSPLYSNFKIHIKNYCSTLTPILHTSIYTFMCYFAETFHRHPYCYFKGHRTNFILTVHAEQLSTNFCFDQDCLYIPVLFIWSCTRTPSKSSAWEVESF